MGYGKPCVFTKEIVTLIKIYPNKNKQGRLNGDLMGSFNIQGLFSSKKKLVALDIGASSLKLAEVDRTSKGYTLRSYHQLLLPKGIVHEGVLEDPQALTAKIKELVRLSKVKRRNVVASLSGNAVISQKVSFATMSSDELRELIQDEASKYLPFDNMDDVNYDFQILGKNEFNANQIDVMLVAAKTDVVERFTNAIRNAGLQPVIMDVDSFALETMYEENYDLGDDEIVALVNIGASVTNINVIKSRGSILRRDFTMAGYNITADMQSNMGLPDLEEAELKKIEGPQYDEPSDVFHEHVLTAAEPILQEIERSIDYFRSTVGGGEISRIFLSGGSARLFGFVEALSQRLNINTEIVNPFKNIAYNKKHFTEEEIEKMGPAAAVCVGLALRMVGDK